MTCERCWRDAGGDAGKYQQLLASRADAGLRCAPEEQAGDDAGICLTCGRKTVHQHAHVCCNPSCSCELLASRQEACAELAELRRAGTRLEAVDYYADGTTELTRLLEAQAGLRARIAELEAKMREAQERALTLTQRCFAEARRRREAEAAAESARAGESTALLLLAEAREGEAYHAANHALAEEEVAKLSAWQKAAAKRAERHQAEADGEARQSHCDSCLHWHADASLDYRGLCDTAPCSYKPRRASGAQPPALTSSEGEIAQLRGEHVETALGAMRSTLSQDVAALSEQVRDLAGKAESARAGESAALEEVDALATEGVDLAEELRANCAEHERRVEAVRAAMNEALGDGPVGARSEYLGLKYALDLLTKESREHRVEAGAYLQRLECDDPVAWQLEQTLNELATLRARIEALRQWSGGGAGSTLAWALRVLDGTEVVRPPCHTCDGTGCAQPTPGAACTWRAVR